VFLIIGNRLRLRAIERSDLARFTVWLNDPEVRRHLSLILPLSLVEEEDWFESMLKRPLREHPYVMEIHQNDDWVPIGNIGLMDIDDTARSAEVGIFIGEKSYWNQGYGTEAMRLILSHAFQTLNLHRVFLHVDETNTGGVRAYEKAGFIHEGRQRAARFDDGKYIDVLMMSILSEEWKKVDQEQGNAN
jgi:diamine N-acetyltransferase